jgi:hypothetical protein
MDSVDTLATLMPWDVTPVVSWKALAGIPDVVAEPEEAVVAVDEFVELHPTAPTPTDRSATMVAQRVILRVNITTPLAGHSTRIRPGNRSHPLKILMYRVPPGGATDAERPPDSQLERTRT